MNPIVYLKSGLCTVWFRIRGIKSSVVGCDGKFPVLYTTGMVKVGSRLIVRGRTARCEIGATEKNARLQIGNRVFINQGASVTATSYVEVGDDTLIGSFTLILDTNWHQVDPHRPVRSAPVIIGTNVWLGHGVTVLPGAKIGDHTVVAAGSVVKGDLPPRVLAAGNPAEVIRELDIPEDGWRRNQ